MRSLTTALSMAAALTALSAPAAAQTAKPPNPCLDVEQRKALFCPDLVMKKPYGLRLDRKIVKGRLMLRAGNSIDNVGSGPAELFGIRTSRYFMRARQRIYLRGGGRIGIATGARLFFKYVPGQTALLEVPLRGEVRALADRLPGRAHAEGAARAEGELLPARPEAHAPAGSLAAQARLSRL